MIHIEIDESELVTVTDPKRVDRNGEISVGRKFTGMIVRAYVVLAEPVGKINNNK